MWNLVAIGRVVLILPVVAFGLLVSPFLGLMSNKVFSFIAQTWYRTLLMIMGIRCRFTGETIRQVTLVVSNHISWADILVIGVNWPFVFLAMRDVARWPVVGWLAKAAGTLFIDRGKGAHQAIHKVSEALTSGRHVVLFPEGKTTPGTTVKRFHSRMFQAAVEAGVPVQPIGIFYHDSGRPRQHGSRITFADEAGLVRSVWRTLAGPPINVEVRVFGPIGPHEDRQHLATQAHGRVSKHVEFTLNS
ncbi:MAG: lysophospholipid acyltransferase family protein [bacterium]